MSDKNNKPLTDTDIVTMLKSEDGDDRKRALKALFPLSRGVVLALTRVNDNQLTATDGLDAPRMFGAMIYLAQVLGKAMGVHLDWVEIPQDAPAVQVVPGAALPPMR